MATLVELRQMHSNGDFKNKVTSAVVIAAYNLIKTGTTPTTEEKAFAVAVMASPDGVGERVAKMVLAANASATVAQIEDATDSAIQLNVDEIVPVIVSVGA